MLFTFAILLLLAAAVYKGFLFVDFQFQVGSFIWGRRLGTKRRSGFVISAAAKEDVQ